MSKLSRKYERLVEDYRKSLNYNVLQSDYKRFLERWWKLGKEIDAEWKKLHNTLEELSK